MMLVVTTASIAFSGVAAGQDVTSPGTRSVQDHNSIVDWRTPWTDRFYLRTGSDIDLVSFNEPRDVRVCLERRFEDIPVEVKFDEKSKMIGSGNCITVQAKNVRVTPAEPLPEAVELVGTVTSR